MWGYRSTTSMVTRTDPSGNISIYLIFLRKSVASLIYYFTCGTEMRLHKLGNFLSWRPTSRYNWSPGATLLMQFREQIKSTRFGVSFNQEIVRIVIATISCIVLKLLNCGGNLVFHIDCRTLR